MRMLLSGLCLAVLVASSSAQAAPWYEGGDLHDATVAQWHASDDRNRLATAGSVTFSCFGADRLKAAGGLPTMKKLSEALVSCANAATAGIPAIAGQEMKQFIALCMIQMTWKCS